ncbi:MAG: hypothetical protein K2X77_01720 [Candidatus Obscuribacterales bacterium]|jgi:hypothetical protein|nr:hypothetical protein [Candidatus Obscuribacterales bacterium]
MTNAAAIQNLGNGFGQAINNETIDLSGIKERATQTTATYVLGFILALIVFIPCFGAAMKVTELAVINLPTVSGLSQSAGTLGFFYSLASIPVLLHLARKNNPSALLMGVALIASMMGTLFQLSF